MRAGRSGDGEGLDECALAGARPGRVRLVLARRPDALRAAVARRVADRVHAPTVVGIDPTATPHADGDLTDVLVDGLARAALEVFPDWYAGVAARFERARFPNAEREILSDDATRRYPDVSGGWLRAAWPRARRGRRLRLPGHPGATEARQLALAIDPESLLLFLSVGSQEGPSPSRYVIARAAEWLAIQTRTPVVLFVPRQWRSDRDLDPVMDDCIDATLDAEWGRLDGDAADAPRAGRVDDARVVVDPAIGRPHGASDAERRLYEALDRADDLGCLFRFNQRLRLDPTSTPRVDLLWPEGRLVVEIDGPEHRLAAHYRDDRLRDYRLLVEGYAVLRVTNEDVMEDVGRVVHMIRTCVDRRRREQERLG